MLVWRRELVPLLETIFSCRLIHIWGSNAVADNLFGLWRLLMNCYKLWLTAPIIVGPITAMTCRPQVVWIWWPQHGCPYMAISQPSVWICWPYVMGNSVLAAKPGPPVDHNSSLCLGRVKAGCVATHLAGPIFLIFSLFLIVLLQNNLILHDNYLKMTSYLSSHLRNGLSTPEA